MCCCPFHPDSTPSFCVKAEQDNTGKCFGCGWYGTIVDYEMEFHKVDFHEAWLRLNDFQCRFPRKGRQTKCSPVEIKQHEVTLTKAQIAQRNEYSDRLATDPWLAGQVCEKRFERSGENWNPNIIQALAIEGSLGWTGDALAFIYSTGIKVRNWPGREFYWECGGPSLWRGHLIEKASAIYLTEGETDAIALLHAGIEEIPGNGVVAAPSATSFKEEWGPLFTGKTVFICFDNDAAGKHGSEIVGETIVPFAKKVFTIDLGGAQ